MRGILIRRMFLNNGINKEAIHVRCLKYKKDHGIRLAGQVLSFTTIQ